MIKLPLYEGAQTLPFENVTPSAYDHGCIDCQLGRPGQTGRPVVRNVCMPAEGMPGGLLVVGDYPGRDEDNSGRPFYGASGRFLRDQIEKHWQGPVAFDNAIKCLDGSTRVRLGDGTSARIADLVRIRYAGEVMAVDDAGLLVRRRVVGWHKSPLAGRSIVKLSFEGARCGNGVSWGSRMTADHRVLTRVGWMPVSEVHGEEIATGMPAPNATQHQLLLGTLLGDAGMGKGRRDITITHTKNQREWVLLKHRVLESLGVSAVKPLQINGHPSLRFRVLSQPSIGLLRDRFYVGKKRVPTDLSDFGFMALAALYFDDGSLDVRPKRSPRAQIAACSFTLEDARRLACRIEAVLGVEGVRASEVSGRVRIFFTVGATRVLSGKLAKYAPSCMAHKMLDVDRGKFDPDVWPLAGPITHWARAIVEKTSGLRDKRAASVYCLDVEEVHNFITPGGVVHNCAPLRRNLPAKALHECSPYLAYTIKSVAPERILACGSNAIMALTGRKMQVVSNRRAYTATADGVRVFVLPNPAAALRNRFIREWFVEDIEWALTADPPLPPFDAEVRVIETEADALQAEAEIVANGFMVYDVETRGPMHDPHWFRVIALAACGLDSESPWVWTHDAIDDPKLRAPLIRLLAHPKVGKIGSNIKYDMLACRSDPRLATVVSPVWGDVRLWRKMIFSEADGHLDVMANLVGMGGHKEEAKAAIDAARKRMHTHRRKHKGAGILPGTLSPGLHGWLEEGGDPMRWVYDEIPKPTLYRYNARDTLSTARLTKLLEPELQSLPGVYRTWVSIVHPAVPALEQVEAWGMCASRSNIDKLGAWLAAKIGHCERQLAGWGFTEPSSQPATVRWLYGPLKDGGLGLKCPKFTDKDNPSVDSAARKLLKGQHPAIAVLDEWHKYDKLRGTYVDGMRQHIAKDGRIHPSLNLDGARSGRLSCSDPNLQNIPRAKGHLAAKMAKDCFIAPPGRVLLQADYSQLELRVAAMLSGDQKMIDIFKSGEDYHLRCARLISQTAWGVKPEDVLPGSEYRSKAKNFVFGLLYGMTDGGLAERMGCTKEEAARIRQAVLGSFPELARWIKSCLATARKTGWTYTWWGGSEARRRNLYQVGYQGDDDQGRRITAENSSFNTPCQGTASDFCLRSVVDIVDWIHEDCVPAKLVITVHDSVILEVEESALEEVAWQLNRIMTAHNSNGVPLVVDQEVGYSWGSLVDLRYHAVLDDRTHEKKYNEAVPVSPGIEAVHVRTDKDANPWLHRYEFNPVVVTEDAAKAWLRQQNLPDALVHPWSQKVV